MKIHLTVFCDGLEVASLNFTTHDSQVLAFVRSGFTDIRLIASSSYCHALQAVIQAALEQYPDCVPSFKVVYENFRSPYEH